MGRYSARGSVGTRAGRVVALLALFLVCAARLALAQSSGDPEIDRAVASPMREIRSRHFVLRTDLSREEAADYLERLETLLEHVSAYWNRPLRGAIECHVIRDLEEIPRLSIAPNGAYGVKTFGGITLMEFHQEGRRQIAKGIVYSAARPEVVQHELVHAYCHQTFGRVGPVWYCEGMAELGRYWTPGDAAVRADPREIEYLRTHPPASLADVTSPAQTTGDGWQNYASRWALCHFLRWNPNYSRQFRRFGQTLLAGRDASFEQTFAANSRELFFEYRLFLDQISPGYRADLCAWDWKRKFDDLRPGRMRKTGITAGRGWQPTGLSIAAGVVYDYHADGRWQIAGDSMPVGADGDPQGRGRLVGAVMNNYRLGAEFELGSKGSLQCETDGNLYLRCRTDWGKLNEDRGQIAVAFRVRPPKAACPAADESRQ